MTGWIEDGVLRFEGLDDNDIARLNARLPDLLNLIKVFEPLVRPHVGDIAEIHAKLPDLLNILNIFGKHVPQISRVLSDFIPIAHKLIAKQQELNQ
jgi:hypothetical protein